MFSQYDQEPPPWDRQLERQVPDNLRHYPTMPEADAPSASEE